MWNKINGIIGDRTPVVMTAQHPFTSKLVLSNVKNFKYTWVWGKSKLTNFLMVKHRPAKKHEDIVVFYRKQCAYYPQMEKGKPYKSKGGGVKKITTTNASPVKQLPSSNSGTRYPSSIQMIKSEGKGVHPTQKPVALMEYLISTYTNPGDTVLDFTMGSGTTGVAAMNLGRSFIGIELDVEYFRIAESRIKAAHEESMARMVDE